MGNLEIRSSAVSGDKAFIQQIRSCSFEGYVHSIFDRTVNILSVTDGELYTVGNCSMDNGPNTLVTTVNRFSDCNLTVSDKVHIENQNLHLANEIIVSINQTLEWQSILPEYPDDIRLLRSNLCMARQYLEAHGKSGGMRSASIPAGTFDAELSRLLEERSQSVLNELSHHNMNNALHNAVGLVGLGPGLTPSGDDFLVGLFTIFNLPNSPFYAYKTFCKEILLETSGFTNPISYMALKKAAIGEVRESIIEFLRSLMEGHEEEIKRSLSVVLNIGSSSGTDIATGLISGLGILVEHRWR